MWACDLRPGLEESERSGISGGMTLESQTLAELSQRVLFRMKGVEVSAAFRYATIC